MGACLSQQYSFDIVMTGLDEAGKTSILRSMLKESNPLATDPTVGYEENKIEMSSCTFIIRAPGGERKIRDLWRHYLQPSTAAMIFVCDATDKNRMDGSGKSNNSESAKNELSILLGYDELQRDAPLLIFANKQDLQNKKPLSREEVVRILDVSKISKNRQVKVFASSAKTGGGIQEGLKWLREILIEKAKNQ